MLELKCENCYTTEQIGETELGKIVCYNCYHDKNMFGFQWKLVVLEEIVGE